MAAKDSHDTSKSRAHKELRRSIITGARQPGERLRLDELARAYHTSITPLRDALQMLAQEGLVTIQPRSGYYVSRTTLKELRELFELREILELAAVERAARRITDECVAQLERVHAGYTSDDDEAYDRYTDENRRFHFLLAEAAGNHQLADALGRLHDRLARFMVLRRGGKSQIHTHARIIEALKEHDVAAARQAMLEELTESRDLILDRVIQEDGASWHV